MLPVRARLARHDGPVTSTAVPPAADQAVADQAAAGPGAGLPRLLLSGAAVAGWTAAAGLGVVAAPVLLAWLAEGATEPATDALSVTAAGWLLGLGATLTSPGASWGLTPLGLTLVTVLLAARGGSWAAETSPVHGRTRAAVLLLAVGVTAALLAGAAAAALTLDAVTVDPGQAAAQAALVTMAGAGCGLVRARRGGWRAVLATLGPPWAGRALLATLAAVAVLTGVSAAALSVATVGGFDTTRVLLSQIEPGPVGGLALLLASLAYLPTMIVWTGAVLVGPGVTIGAAVTVRSTGVEAGAVPGFPLLGIVPSTMPGWVPVLGVLGMVGAGAVAGLLLARRRGPAEDPLRLALLGLAVGMGTAAITGVACWAASGPMGPGLLGQLGPNPSTVAGVAGAAVGLTAAVTGSVIGAQSTRSAAES